MHDYNLDEADPIINNIDVSTQFVYPESELTSDQIAEQIVSEKFNELFNRIAILTLTSRNPQLTLISLFIASGIDLSLILECDNTESAIAKKFGYPKQTLSLSVNKIRTSLNLQHSPSKKIGMTQEKYNISNFRKPKIT